MGDILDIKRSECYEENDANGNFHFNETFCKLVFDGIMCWPATKAGLTAEQPCPTYIPTLQDFATKKCEDDGEWYVNESTNNTWTNYSQCWTLIDEETALVNIDKIENSTQYQIWFPIIKYVTQSGYVISLIALVSAMVVFSSIKKLQCSRNKLHMHLFVSFIMRAFMALLKDSTFIEGVGMKSDLVYNDGKLKYVKEHHLMWLSWSSLNFFFYTLGLKIVKISSLNWICKAITIVRNYFIVANYLLILMEGIYLYNLLFLTLCNDQSRIVGYYISGWGLPLLFIIPWIALKLKYENTMCWTIPSNKNFLMLIHGPIAASILINFVLFILIIRILLIKLNTIYIQHQRSKYRRLIRSTLILIPLFGVPYVMSLIVSVSSSENVVVEVVWLFLDQTFTAFQGLFAALVYCLLNSEVHTEIKHRFNSLRDRREHKRISRERTISHTLQYPTTIVPINEEIVLHNLGTNF